MNTFPNIEPQGKSPSSGTRLKNTLEEMKAAGAKPLGSGFQKVVYPHPDDPTKVIRDWTGNSEMTQTRMKKDHYLSKLLHVLFPDDFPDVLESLPSHKIGTAERIESNKNTLKVLLLKSLKSYKAEMNARKLGVLLDSKSSNFIMDQQGKVKYIDTPLFGNPNAIRAEIEKNLTGDKKVYALALLDNFIKYNDLYKKENKEKMFGKSRE